MIHRRKHPSLDVEGCFSCRISTVNMSAVGMSTTAGREVTETKQHWDQWDKDRTAWRRMWDQGAAPSTINGSARVEALAQTEFEATSGQIHEDQKALKTALSIAADSGITT